MFLGEKIYRNKIFFRATPILSFAIKETRSNNTMSSITCSEWNVASRCSLRFLQLLLVKDIFQSPPAMKSNLTLVHSGISNYQLELRGCQLESSLLFCRNIKVTNISGFIGYD